jgi:PhzF family phenazine biosynthesis protein
MTTYAFRLLNVFTDTTFGGNQLCVFEDARGLDDATMQALALQFNLAETTFVLPSDKADAHVRIFTPDFEMPFAGHPTLGTAQVVRALKGAGDALTFQLKAGPVPVQARGDVWTLTAPVIGVPKTETPTASSDEIATLLGLRASDIVAPPLWVDTGSEQMMVPVGSVDAVRRAQPNAALVERWPANALERKSAYVFAYDGTTDGEGRIGVEARYFYAVHGGGFVEDPGTGSACANLGGWLLTTGAPLPGRYRIAQGAATRRSCQLLLDVRADGRIQVGGKVIEIGRGTISL